MNRCERNRASAESTPKYVRPKIIYPSKQDSNTSVTSKHKNRRKNMFVPEKTNKYNHFLIVTSELIKQANMLWYNGNMVHGKYYVNSLFHLFNPPFL